MARQMQPNLHSLGLGHVLNPDNRVSPFRPSIFKTTLACLSSHRRQLTLNHHPSSPHQRNPSSRSRTLPSRLTRHQIDFALPPHVPPPGFPRHRPRPISSSSISVVNSPSSTQARPTPTDRRYGFLDDNLKDDAPPSSARASVQRKRLLHPQPQDAREDAPGPDRSAGRGLSGELETLSHAQPGSIEGHPS